MKNHKKCFSCSGLNQTLIDFNFWSILWTANVQMCEALFLVHPTQYILRNENDALHYFEIHQLLPIQVNLPLLFCAFLCGAVFLQITSG